MEITKMITDAKSKLGIDKLKPVKEVIEAIQGIGGYEYEYEVIGAYFNYVVRIYTRTADGFRADLDLIGDIVTSGGIRIPVDEALETVKKFVETNGIK
jgi:hypothetical protein